MWLETRSLNPKTKFFFLKSWFQVTAYQLTSGLDSGLGNLRKYFLLCNEILFFVWCYRYVKQVLHRFFQCPHCSKYKLSKSQYPTPNQITFSNNFLKLHYQATNDLKPWFGCKSRFKIIITFTKPLTTFAAVVDKLLASAIQPRQPSFPRAPYWHCTISWRFLLNCSRVSSNLTIYSRGLTVGRDWVIIGFNPTQSGILVQWTWSIMILL